MSEGADCTAHHCAGGLEAYFTVVQVFIEVLLQREKSIYMALQLISITKLILLLVCWNLLEFVAL